MDLRKSFDTILKKYGHNVYIQRLCTSCNRTGAYQKYDQECTECAGTGYSRTLEIHSCRRMLAQGGSKGSAEGIEYTPQGGVPTHGWVYYFRHDTHPEQGDRIYDDGQILRVNEVYDPRGPTGRVEYYICRTKRIEGKAYGG